MVDRDAGRRQHIAEHPEGFEPTDPGSVMVCPAMARSSASDRGPSSGGGSMRIRSTA